MLRGMFGGDSTQWELPEGKRPPAIPRERAAVEGRRDLGEVMGSVEKGSGWSSEEQELFQKEMELSKGY